MRPCFLGVGGGGGGREEKNSINLSSAEFVLTKCKAMQCGSVFDCVFNDTSTLVGHFVSSPREREKRDSKEDEREG